MLLTTQALFLALGVSGLHASSAEPHEIQPRTGIEQFPALVEFLTQYTGLSINRVRRNFRAAVTEASRLEDYGYNSGGEWYKPAMPTLSTFDLPTIQEFYLNPLLGDPDALFLDVGGYFSADMRYLIHMGAPAEKLWTSNLEAGVFEQSYNAFGDGYREGGPLMSNVVAPSDLRDPRDPDGALVAKLGGKATAINVTNVFGTLGDRRDIMSAIRTLFKLLRFDARTQPFLYVDFQGSRGFTVAQFKGVWLAVAQAHSALANFHSIREDGRPC